ncbi:MAG: extracellular solute-binding protein [Treponema sp.]|nr:extracellular solute-binding protein [Treponema sp.]
MKKKNFAAAVLMIALFLIPVITPITAPVFAGGKGQVSGSISAPTAVTAEKGQFPLTSAKSQLSLLCTKPPYLSDFNINDAAKWVENKTNVHVTYVHLPYEGTSAATNLLIAAGDYPDIMMNAGLSTNDAMNYGNQGIIIPLNDLITNHGYWFQEAVKQVPEIPSAIVMPDGKIYGMPNINQAFHTFYSLKAWIYDPWLKKLNLNTPTTTDEFYNVLKAFKTGNPNGNGRPVIPMMGYYASAPRTYPYVFLLNAFVYFNPGSYLAMANGKVTFVANTEDYREGLRYVARLVSEGLLDSASFTQNASQAKQIGTDPAGPRIGVFTDFVWWNFVEYNYNMPDKRADFYPALAPLKGPKGLRVTPVQGTGFNLDFAHITDHAKDPVLAFRWLDALYNLDVTEVTQFGIKGLYWDDPTPGALGINRKPALYRVLKPFPSEGDTGSVRNVFMGNRYSDLRLGEQANWSNPATAFDQEPRLYQETMDKYYPYRPAEGTYVPLVLNQTATESGEVSRLTEQINTYVQENLVAFITGNKSLDRDWAAYTAEFQRLDLQRYLALKQTAYDRQYGKK